jgi:hypothetical protein
MPLTPSKLLECLAPVRSFPDQLHVRLIPNQRSDALAKQGMVVYRENSSHLSSTFFPNSRQRERFGNRP